MILLYVLLAMKIPNAIDKIETWCTLPYYRKQKGLSITRPLLLDSIFRSCTSISNTLKPFFLDLIKTAHRMLYDATNTLFTFKLQAATHLHVVSCGIFSLFYFYKDYYYIRHWWYSQKVKQLIASQQRRQSGRPIVSLCILHTIDWE